MTSADSGYLDPDGGVTVEIEWFFSHLLNHPEYSHLDDITRKQKLQMLYAYFFTNFKRIKLKNFKLTCCCKF